jgi:hypothetical protein
MDRGRQGRQCKNRLNEAFFAVVLRKRQRRGRSEDEGKTGRIVLGLVTSHTPTRVSGLAITYLLRSCIRASPHIEDVISIGQPIVCTFFAVPSAIAAV